MCDVIDVLHGWTSYCQEWSEMFDKQASSSSNACSSFLIVILVHSLSVLDKCVILVCSM